MTEHNFDTNYSEYESLPDLEKRLIRYSRIMFDLSMPGQIRKHEHTFTHYKKQMIALRYQYAQIKGNDSFTEKVDNLIIKVDKLREIEYKS